MFLRRRKKEAEVAVAVAVPLVVGTQLELPPRTVLLDDGEKRVEETCAQKTCFANQNELQYFSSVRAVEELIIAQAPLLACR